MSQNMFKVNKYTKLSQDQRLSLQSKLMEYVREALTYKTGWVVFEVKDLKSFEFEIYYSSDKELVTRIEEPRSETLDRILYVIGCEELSELQLDDDDIDEVLQYLFNYIVGFISVNIMYEVHGISDHSYSFKEGPKVDE